MTWEYNIHSSPERFGLTVVATAEFGGSWEFDTSVLWRNADGVFLYARDSGCSCPTPFENTTLSDLIVIEHAAQLKQVMLENHTNIYRPHPGIGEHPELVRMLEMAITAGLGRGPVEMEPK